MRHRIRYTSNRWLSLVYRGLDWLPPGDAGFAELVQAMVAADRLFLPNDEFARRVLVEEAARRHIVVRECEAASTRLDGMSMDRGSILEAFREELQVPGDARVKVTIRPFHVYEPEIVVRSTDDVYKLTPKVLPEWIVPENEHFLVKFAWWYTERNDLSPAWGAGRRVRTGATIVIDRNGTVRALIRNQPALQASSRSALLKRLCAGDLERPARRVGPDGAPLHDGPRATVRGDTLRIAGAMQALHVSGDDLWMP